MAQENAEVVPAWNQAFWNAGDTGAFAIFTLRKGRIFFVEYCWDHDEAQETVGSRA